MGGVLIYLNRYPPDTRHISVYAYFTHECRGEVRNKTRDQTKRKQSDKIGKEPKTSEW